MIDEPAPVPKPNRIAAYIIAVALIIAGISLAILLFWSFQSDEVLVVHNNPFPSKVIKQEANGDSIVILDTDYCKNQSVHGKVRISFVSRTREVFLPISNEDQPSGCHKVNVPVLVPRGIEPGTYKIKFRATYDINPLKKGVVSEFESKEFVLQ